MVLFRVEYNEVNEDGEVGYEVKVSDPFYTHDEAYELRAKLENQPKKYRNVAVVPDSSDD
ncbi:hypothetical protein J7J00_17570 [Bacillus sp. ISL-4]|uniref:hypothetical protein n=1 Tax=Bacillus sp. ISL-4 TaxID=2819125 RepID=UPI001BEC6D28|nr:hypothetical protein [Bacillus sp. ISL-4]MBT2667292.1 hypothetical protein [Bacillus sp. ISL-4]MBT2670598.1 hypothetical protein [Streptomyces sp. ISL-14]